MTDEERWQGFAIYALYLVALVSGVPFLIGVILAYVFKSNASPAIASHFEHQIGLFWRFVIGNVVAWTVLIIGLSLIFVLIGLPLVFAGGLALVWLWVMMLVRCVRGIGRLNAREGYPVPAGFGL